MNKDDAEGIPHDGQHPEPLMQGEIEPEEIIEVEADFEETKLSGDEADFQSPEDQEEQRE